MTEPTASLRILIVGATGFVGGHLARRLAARHRVVAMARSARKLAGLPGCEPLAVDPGRLETPEAWRPHLAGIDVVVNALGAIFGDFERLHRRVPVALFEACRAAGVRHVVQVSALGAAPDAPTEFLRSKAAADAHLEGMDGLAWTIVRPSVVLGPGGGSSRLFAALAALPLTPRFGKGGGLLQPIHLDDLTAGLAALVEAPDGKGVLAATGPEPGSLDDLLPWYRQWLDMPPARRLTVPPRLMEMLAPLAGALGVGPVDADTLAMLRRGNTAPCEPFAAATGVTPAGPDEIRRRNPTSPGERLAARLFFLRPLLRLSLAFLWIATAAVSLGLYPVSESFALLAAVGVTGLWQPMLLHAAAVWDGLLGLLLLLGWKVRLVGWLQVATILAFTAIITLFIPEFWLHPFGPVTKNVPIVVATLLMIVLEDEP